MTSGRAKESVLGITAPTIDISGDVWAMPPRPTSERRDVDRRKLNYSRLQTQHVSESSHPCALEVSWLRAP